MCDECRYPGELAKQEPDEEPDDRPGAPTEPPVIYDDELPF